MNGKAPSRDAACPEEREHLFAYLDGELEGPAARAYEEHLARCPACAATVARQRAMEAWIRRVPPPASGEAWVEDLLRALPMQGDTGPGVSRVWEEAVPRTVPSRAGRRARLIVLAAAAAVLFLLCLWIPRSERPSPTGGAAPAAAATDTRPSPEERRKALEAFDGILRRLARVPVEKLAGRFEEETASLRAEGWNVEILLAGALRRTEGKALLGALRLAGTGDRIQRLPGAVSTLAARLEEGVFPEAVVELLAADGSARAVATLGRALRRPDVREAALVALCRAGGKDAVRVVERELLYRTRARRGKEGLRPETEEALRTLAGMGREGVESVLAFYRRSGFSDAVVRALEPRAGTLASALETILPRLRGSTRDAGLHLAAGLRMPFVLAVLFERGRAEGFTGETPFLAARVGGPEAVRTLERMYEAPVSLRARRNVALALVDLFRRHPEETDRVLEACMEKGEGGAGGENLPGLLDMLAAVGNRTACRVLAWIAARVPERASEAALALARTGSPRALEELENLLRAPDLPNASRVSVAAAAYHLGGRAALEGTEAGEAHPFPSGPGLLRDRGTITEARFHDLRERMARWMKRISYREKNTP